MNTQRLVEERWRPIHGYEGLYEVSDQGQVRSLDRIVRQGSRWGGTFTRLHVGQVLQPRPRLGYLTVILASGGKDKTKTIHQLVLEAFVGPRPENMEACHNNGAGSDNRLANLRWGTRQSNAADKFLHGTHNRGERNPQNKLSEHQVRLARSLYQDPEYRGLMNSLAKAWGVSKSAVVFAAKGKRWGWLDA